MNCKTFNEFLTESFDTISDFLLNPEHRDKTWQQLMDEFEADGGEHIGGGRHGSVFMHPKWPYVLKTFNDEHYLKFARFAYRNPHPSLPKLYGPPQKILPFYLRQPKETTMYIARIEKLQPVTDRKMLSEIIKVWDRGTGYIHAVKTGAANQTYTTEVLPDFEERRRLRASGQPVQRQKVEYNPYQDMIDFIKKYPKTYSLFEAMYLVFENIKQSASDIHPENIMQRSNGDLVLTDPLWEGSNPYADYQHMMDMETDAFAYADDGPPPPTVRGGEWPKKKRARKPKAPTYTASNNNDDIPF